MTGGRYTRIEFLVHSFSKPQIAQRGMSFPTRLVAGASGSLGPAGVIALGVMICAVIGGAVGGAGMRGDDRRESTA